MKDLIKNNYNKFKNWVIQPSSCILLFIICGILIVTIVPVNPLVILLVIVLFFILRGRI